MVVAVTGTAAGFAFDAGSGKELTTVFAALYVLGCVVAVLAVRQSGVFTAVIQPPLILFCAVPGAYWLFHGAKFTGLKDLLINCGYPLIERFPLMLFTSGGVLVHRHHPLVAGKGDPPGSDRDGRSRRTRRGDRRGTAGRAGRQAGVDVRRSSARVRR